MIAEREIAGFVLPFVAGIMTATLLSSTYFSHSIVPATASVILTFTFLFHLIHPLRQNWKRSMIVSFVILSAAGCGLLAGFSHKLLSISQISNTSPIPDQLSLLGEALRSSIDRLPFESTATNHIIEALITGRRKDIPQETLNAFRTSGASHILALSGLHLGIIYGMISKFLTILGHSAYADKVRALITVTTCGIYTVITGAGASITRAFLFISVGETARLFGRHKSLVQLLMVSLFLQLLLYPDSISDIGFQLSYAAISGIAFIFPWLKRLWPEGKGGLMRWIWGSAAMSIACQITTGPLAYLYFGTFPQHFILTNLLVLPLTGLIIPASLITIILHGIGFCPYAFIWTTEALVGLLTDILRVISTM